jgi:hypothetical protein
VSSSSQESRPRPEWQRVRAIKLHEICQWIESMIPVHGKMLTLKKAAEQFHGIELPNGQGKPKRLKFGYTPKGGTPWRLYERWLAHGKTPAAFDLEYASPTGKASVELVTEWRRRLVKRGKQSAGEVYKTLCRAWESGQDIPGLGTWQDWWSLQNARRAQRGQAALPLPHRAPDFPLTYSSMMRHAPDKLTRALGNFGLVAARDAIRHITRDSSHLRIAEVITFDDKDIDQKVIDDVYGTRSICKPTLYLAMDIGPRFIPAFIIRPTKALARDVDELVALVLHRYGRGNGYATHFLFERGTTACSEAREKYFNGLFPNQLFVHRTGMIQGYAYAGQWKEETTGKACSKGMLEAFNGKLDFLLQQLPGKDGRTQLTRHAEDLMAIERATGLTLSAPLLRLSQLAMIVRKAIELYHADHRHTMQGFHKISQIQTAPGVWSDLPTYHPGEIEHAVDAACRAQ